MRGGDTDRRLPGGEARKGRWLRAGSRRHDSAKASESDDQRGASGAGGDVGGGTAATGDAGASGASGGAAAPAATGGAPAVEATGGAPTGDATGGASTGGAAGAPPIIGTASSNLIPADRGIVVLDLDVSGVIGFWYTYQDEGGSLITPAYEDPNGFGPFGSYNGEFCYSGVAIGHNDVAFDTNWGVGVGLGVCQIPWDADALPADLAGQPLGARFQAADCLSLPETRPQRNHCRFPGSAVSSAAPC